jgi:hypothetical protein
MLKIKDDVDLKELEKFGFKDDDENGYYLYKVGNTQFFRIKKWNRIIDVIQEIVSIKGERRIVSEEILNALYDLIQEGFIENIRSDYEK